MSKSIFPVIKTTLALSVAIVIGTASAAMATSRHVGHPHGLAVQRQLSAADPYGYAGFGAVYPAYTGRFQMRGPAGGPRCWGGNCDPNWGGYPAVAQPPGGGDGG